MFTRTGVRFAMFMLSLLIALLCVLPEPAGAQDLAWVRQFGTNNVDEALAVAKAPSGVYVTGYTWGVFPGQSSAGPEPIIDAFLSRFDESGNVLWHRQFGSVLEDRGTGVAADLTGVYVVGWTQAALPGQTYQGGALDAFIRKYDFNGNVLWTRQFGTNELDEALAVAADGTGVYVAGSADGVLAAGGGDSGAFIRRYDANGTEVWTRQFGGGGTKAYGVTTDSTGIYVAGYTLGGRLVENADGSGFLRKYDTGGNVIWTRQFGTSQPFVDGFVGDTVYAVAAGALGVYVVGETIGTFAGQARVGGQIDAFVLKFDVAGTQQWVRQFGSNGNDAAYGVSVGAASVVVVGTAEDSLPGQTSRPAYYVLYDFDGGLQGVNQFGDSSNDKLAGIAADVTGAYAVGTKFGGSLGQVTLGQSDAVVLKINMPPPTSLLFSISNFTGISTATDGTGPLSIGHARINATIGTTPSGVAIFGYRREGILVTEAGVPDSPLITSGRIYGEVSANGAVNIGLAIANPNDQTANITFTLTDTAGTAVKTGSTTIPPNGQVASFLSEPPYSSGNGFQGTLTFTSNTPVGVIALRSLLNERNDFLITTLPVIDLSKGAASGTQVIPHFAVGDGWGTQIILVNPTDTAQTGTVQFFGPGLGSAPGTLVTVNIDGTAASSAPYTVAPRSSRKLVASAAAPGLTVGTVRIVPTNAGPVPTPLVAFAYKPAAFTLSEAGVPVSMGTAFRMYAEASTAPAIETGFAIANTTNAATTVTLEVMTLNGTPVATSPPVPVALPASGQRAGFLSDFFPRLPRPFQGVLRVSTTAVVSVVALRSRYNERGDFLITTTPPTLETGTPAAVPRSFPDFVNGEGWTTQFVLFSGTTGQSSTGIMRFSRQNGSPLPVTLR